MSNLCYDIKMNKISEFPDFKKLELADKEVVEKFTSKFLPYSDFNFANLWSWNIHHKMMICQLNNNLVVLFNDYLSAEYFLSFIGENKIPETASELIEFSKKHYHTNYLKLIPEEIAKVLSEYGFNVTPDRDSHDYVYSVEDLANMVNWIKSNKPKKINEFLKSYPEYKVKLSSIGEILNDEHKEMFKKWAMNKNIENHFELNEFKAFERILQVENDNIIVLSLYIEGVLVGFTIYEIISGDYAIAHFSKADVKYHSSIYDLLNWEEGKALKSENIKYYNWELDLGIPGLRYSKEKYNPAFFLKKFIIRK